MDEVSEPGAYARGMGRGVMLTREVHAALSTARIIAKMSRSSEAKAALELVCSELERVALVAHERGLALDVYGARERGERP